MLGFNHMRENKFRLGFKDTLNPCCYCSIEAETTIHYSQRCHFYNANRATVMNDLESTPISFSVVSENNLISLFTYGDDKFEDINNRKTSKDLQRFDKQRKQLLLSFLQFYCYCFC